MVLKFKENSVNISDIKNALTKKFGEKYIVTSNGKSVVVAKSKTIGAIVFVMPSKINVVGNFPKKWMSILFTFSVIGLGVLVPLLVYYLVFHKKMKTLEKEVGGFLKEKFSDNIQI